MRPLVYPKANKSALGKAKELVVLLPARHSTAAKLPKLFDAGLKKQILALAQGAAPGPEGRIAETRNPTSKLSRLVVGVLPNEVSRYNAAARPAAVEACARKAMGLGLKTPTFLFLLDDESHQLAVLNALGRALPVLSMKSGKKDTGKVSALCATTGGAWLDVPKDVRIIVDAAREVAGLVDTPPSELHPEAFAAWVKKRCRDLGGVQVKEIAGDALLKQGMGGLHAVGRGATSKPRLLIASHHPRGATDHVALIGKGITFDTGGLHLKPRGAIEGMKSDMGGAAATLGAFLSLVEAKVPVKLTLLLCLAENAIDSGSYKPDDVLTLHSGKTVEINNTDAEGRLVLSDGLSYAARVLKATTLIDAATLTGAQLIALGRQHAAVVSNDAALEKCLVDSGQATGDLAHALPFAPEFYQPEFDSKLADMKNSVKNRFNAQTSCAGQFLYAHIEDTDTAWCHIDLAGPAFRGERGTGYGVALMHCAIKQWLEVA